MKAVSLISGGIDSAVSSCKFLKKGFELVFVHFHQQSEIGRQNKVVEIVRHLRKFGNVSKLYMVPFKDIQKEIIMHVPGDLRMLVYRRMMLRIAEKILHDENASAFITGDSLGQVASQTVENLSSVYSVTPHPIFTPLLGEDKKDIMKIAREIETYELSILPYEDCCSFLISPHPETRSTMEEIKDAEKSLDVERLAVEGYKNAKLVDL